MILAARISRQPADRAYARPVNAPSRATAHLPSRGRLPRCLRGIATQSALPVGVALVMAALLGGGPMTHAYIPTCWNVFGAVVPWCRAGCRAP